MSEKISFETFLKSKDCISDTPNRSYGVFEEKAERKRTLRWGPRTLDLDIVFFDKLVYEVLCELEKVCGQSFRGCDKHPDNNRFWCCLW